VGYDANFNHSPLSCGMAGSPPQMKNLTACNTDLYTAGGLAPGYKSLDLSYTPPGLMGGACTSGALTNSSNLTYAASDTLCTPTTEPCTGNECTPSFGSLDVCITSPGNVACPGSPFTHQHIVGGAATFSCSSNGCGCQVTGTCSGTLTFYTNNNCTGTSQTAPVNGSCMNGSTAFNSNTYASYGYAPAPLQSSCDSSGTSAAQNVTQPNLQTVCCTQ